MKILERLVDDTIREKVHIDECKINLVLSQDLYMAFVDLGKAFDCIPHKVIWWAMHKVVIEEWIV